MLFVVYDTYDDDGDDADDAAAAADDNHNANDVYTPTCTAQSILRSEQTQGTNK